MNEQEILNLAQQYGLKAEIKGRAVYIFSMGNQWYFYIDDIPKQHIPLYHKNPDSHKHRDRYHLQRVYLDLPFMFSSIASHEEFTFTPNRKKQRIDYIFDLIKQEKPGKKQKKGKHVS